MRAGLGTDKHCGEVARHFKENNKGARLEPIRLMPESNILKRHRQAAKFPFKMMIKSVKNLAHWARTR